MFELLQTQESASLPAILLINKVKKCFVLFFAASRVKRKLYTSSEGAGGKYSGKNTTNLKKCIYANRKVFFFFFFSPFLFSLLFSCCNVCTQVKL